MEPSHASTLLQGRTMKQAADGVYPLGTSGHTFYIVRDGDGVTLIDLGCSRWSPDAIVDLEADPLLPGHGRPWSGLPAEAVARARG